MKITDLIAFFVAVLLSVSVVQAQDLGHPHSDPSFGYYGYGHLKLHQYGVIENLMDKTGKNCCDGGHGGECRITMISRTDGVPKAYIDGKWCPILDNVTIFRDIPLPPNAFAAVCAGKSKHLSSCPSIYCAAETPGM